MLTHRHLLCEVWGPSHAVSTHYVCVYMGTLRQKLEADPAQPRHIVTETGVGYRLLAEPGQGLMDDGGARRSLWR